MGPAWFLHEYAGEGQTYDPSCRGSTLSPDKVTKGKDDGMMNYWRYPDAQQDYDFLEECYDSHCLLQRTLHALPTEVDKDFNMKYYKAKYGAYLVSTYILIIASQLLPHRLKQLSRNIDVCV